MTLARYDLLLTTGRVDDPGWHRTSPCVHLPSWPVTAPGAVDFCTVSHWWAPDEWIVEEGVAFANDKRTGFLPFLELPRLTSAPLELALSLGSGTKPRPRG